MELVELWHLAGAQITEPIGPTNAAPPPFDAPSRLSLHRSKSQRAPQAANTSARATDQDTTKMLCKTRDLSAEGLKEHGVALTPVIPEDMVRHFAPPSTFGDGDATRRG
jgi:hypothetical protein